MVAVTLASTGGSGSMSSHSQAVLDTFMAGVRELIAPHAGKIEYGNLRCHSSDWDTGDGPCITNVAIVYEIIDAGNGDGLGQVPVGGREGEARGGDRAFCRVVRGDSNDDICSGLAVEHDIEADVAAGLGGGQTAGGADGDTGGVIVGVGERHIRCVHSAVDAVAADRRARAAIRHSG